MFPHESGEPGQQLTNRWTPSRPCHDDPDDDSSHGHGRHSAAPGAVTIGEGGKSITAMLAVILKERPRYGQRNVGASEPGTCKVATSNYTCHRSNLVSTRLPSHISAWWTLTLPSPTELSKTPAHRKTAFHLRRGKFLVRKPLDKELAGPLSGSNYRKTSASFRRH